MADTIADFPSDTSLPLGNLGTIGIGQGVSSSGTIDLLTFGDHDVFKVVLTAGVTYRITMDGAASGFSLNDPRLTFETFISDNDSGVGNNSYILFTPDVNGTYFIDAHAAVAGEIGTYVVSVIGLDPFSGAAETTFAFMSGSSELPSSQAANLPQFAQTQFTFGQQIGVLSPTVAMYEALGLALSEISPALQGILSPGNASDSVFVGIVYDAVFGIQPGAAQAQHFLTQLDFYETIYLASGAFGQDITRIETLARGAVIGQMLGVKADNADNNAPTAAANLINDSGVSIVGAPATMDFELL